MIHRGMRTPCNEVDSQRGMIKWDVSHPKKGGSVVEESTLSTGLALHKEQEQEQVF